MGFERWCFVKFFSLIFLISGTNQLHSSQTQVLLQLRKHLEYPKQLEYWIDKSIDPCLSSSPLVNISCQDNIITEIRIYGDKHERGSTFNGYAIDDQTLSSNFSMDSLLATLSRLNNLKVLSLVSLGIWGPIPVKIHRLLFLEQLDLSWNFFYGSIPPTLSRIVNLEVLKLDGNFLNCTVPDWFHTFSNFTSLSLRSNKLNGPLSSSISKATSLTDINLSNNEISGKMVDLSSLVKLSWLDLSNNKLDWELSTMPKGLVACFLSNNSFSGAIPQQYGVLIHLRQLDLSRNYLQGTVPFELFAFPNITLVNLSSNMLTGSISTSLSCSSNLELVDISNNKLKGFLPSCLSSNVKTRAVKFDGNCLSDLEHQRPETYCVEEKRKSDGMNVGVIIGVICGIVIILALLAFCFLVLCRKYCPRETSEKHLLNISDQENCVKSFPSELLTDARFISMVGSQVSLAHRLFSFNELKLATNNFDESTMIGEGSNGKIYKGRLENGIQVAIRRLKVSKRYTIRNLRLRLNLLAKLKHPNLVCLLGHCISMQEKDEACVDKVYLIYEFVSNGNYQALLSEKAIRWRDRLTILVDIAKAIHFLHNGIIPGFFNNRLKSKNILINENQTAKLSDYGLSVVAQERDKDEFADGIKSWQITNEEDDVFCFGMILLESLVGPSVIATKESSSFLFNEMGRNLFNGSIDPIVVSSSNKESLSIIISLTINCISPQPSNRPTFEDVLCNLQYASQLHS